MKPTNGKRPRTGDRPLMVQFRNGWVVGPYTADKLIWQDRGWESDIVAVEFADAVKAASARPANGSYNG